VLQFAVTKHHHRAVATVLTVILCDCLLFADHSSLVVICLIWCAQFRRALRMLRCVQMCLRTYLQDHRIKSHQELFVCCHKKTLQHTAFGIGWVITGDSGGCRQQRPTHAFTAQVGWLGFRIGSHFAPSHIRQTD